MSLATRKILINLPLEAYDNHENSAVRKFREDGKNYGKGRGGVWP
jgi:hypothetical protein